MLQQTSSSSQSSSFTKHDGFWSFNAWISRMLPSGIPFNLSCLTKISLCSSEMGQIVLSTFTYTSGVHGGAVSDPVYTNLSLTLTIYIKLPRPRRSTSGFKFFFQSKFAKKLSMICCSAFVKILYFSYVENKMWIVEISPFLPVFGSLALWTIYISISNRSPSIVCSDGQWKLMLSASYKGISLVCVFSNHLEWNTFGLVFSAISKVNFFGTQSTLTPF